jgi:mono/diheme cytochrome c family protein
MIFATLALGRAGAPAAGAGGLVDRWQPADYHDGHARPRALAFNVDDGLLYAALSTADTIAVVDPAAAPPRLLRKLPVCRFPATLAAVPGGGVLVACRFDPALRRVWRDGSSWRVTAIEAGAESGARGLALAPGGTVAYVASPPDRGVKVVPLARGGVEQVMPTGISPRALRVVPADALPGRRGPLLLVSNFVDHTITVHPIRADGRLEPALQTIATEAPVLDLAVAGGAREAGPALLLLTHEDRPLSRAHGPVEGLDSGVLRLPAVESPAPFRDPGRGARAFVNLGDRPAAPVIELAAIAADPASGALALVGAGTDNLLLAAEADGLSGGAAVGVGTAPAAVAALAGGRWVTADRLSDTLTFVGADRVTATLTVGRPDRPSAAERGELLFYSRALVPNNVADGPLSLYTCAACHDDGHVDGRRHPAKRNRFFSMTKTCRGLATTAPYFSLGEPDTLEAFADNIVATHAQGAERDPDHFDRYPVTLRVREGGRWTRAVLSPAQVRGALAAYMARIPPEPSPYVTPGQRALTDQERRGLGLFRGNCSGCHRLVGSTTAENVVPAADLESRLLARQVALTSASLHDVGTPVLGEGDNNPPSLRGVWDAAPYFSDGSARTLEELLLRTAPAAPKVHAPGNAGRPAFTAEDRAALLAFLKVL